MNGYEAQRKALREHAEEVIVIRNDLREGAGRFSRNPRVTLVKRDFTWAGDAVLAAYDEEKMLMFGYLQGVANTLSDISESVKVAAATYGATEAAVEKAIADLSRKLKEIEFQRRLPAPIIPDYSPNRP